VTPELVVRLFRYRLLGGLAAIVFALDQVTKIWINSTLEFESYFPPDRITIIPGFFHLVHVGNTGAAWGLFRDRSIWLAVLAVFTLGAIYLFRRHLDLARPIVQVSFGLLCGGIVGNLVDRIVHGHVIDFLLFTFGSFDWPAFNLADTAICIGVGLYLLQSLRDPRPSGAS
jgi:signal peptidase II